MILVGANVYTSGQVTPDANDYHSYFGVTTSIILRMGIEAFFFLVLFIGQVRGGREDWSTGPREGGAMRACTCERGWAWPGRVAAPGPCRWAVRRCSVVAPQSGQDASWPQEPPRNACMQL